MVNISSDSAFASFGSTVNTKHFHHQVVKKVGKGLRVTMRDVSDGEIEGVEGINEPVFGIQWHPDLMGNAGKGIFKTFIKICRSDAIGRL
jgi:gamma-glutamyl-gamma-aminobutyrate hydrolase PuuD